MGMLSGVSFANGFTNGSIDYCGDSECHSSLVSWMNDIPGA